MRVPAATKTKRQVAGAPYDRPPSSLPQTKPKATTGKQGSQPSAQDPENLDLGQADESEEMRVEREWIVSQLEDLECAAGIRDTRSSESSSWDTIHTRLFALQKTVGDLLSSNESLSRHADMIELERDDALRRVKEMDTLVRRFEEENAAMRGWGEEMKRQRDERGMAWKVRVPFFVVLISLLLLFLSHRISGYDTVLPVYLLDIRYTRTHDSPSFNLHSNLHFHVHLRLYPSILSSYQSPTPVRIRPLLQNTPTPHLSDERSTPTPRPPSVSSLSFLRQSPNVPTASI
ncbi:hypothetical protein ONZ45_g631 [Pleurotus djamor]|nr:hypothetical protein ONZ45_g631 [Pleurotus djamor]